MEGRKIVVCWLSLVCWVSLGASAGGRDLAGTEGATAASPQHNHRQHHHHHHPQTCTRTQEEFTKLGLGALSMVPETPLHDNDMEICYKGSRDTHTVSCCNRKMEHKYRHHAEKDFYDTMQLTSEYLRDLIAKNIAFNQAQYLTLLEEAENQTGMLFDTESYLIPLEDRREAIKGLFLDLNAYVRHRDVDIRDSVGQFFDELFPLVFHHILNDPTTLSMPEDYRECLTELRRDLTPHPFGDIPHQVAQQLSRSLGATRTYLEALSLGIEAINTTDHQPLEQSCQRALARLRYCAICQGHTEARPCRNYCYNVLRGCLAIVGEVDRHWDEFVDAVHALTQSMRGSRGIEATLRGFPARLAEAIMHAMESAPKFYAQVKQRCGQPKPAGSSPSSSSLSSRDKPATPVSPLEGSSVAALQPRMDTFMRSLMASKGFYRNLADTLCSTEKFGTGLDADHCWTGHNMGRYNQTLIDVGLDVQMTSNPEVKVTGSRTSDVTTLIDKLQHVIKLLKSKVSFESMQSDDWNMDVYGSGAGIGTQSDDEDYADFSGSGSGYPGWSDGPRKGSQNPGYGSDHDILFEETPSDPPPYVTPKSPGRSVDSMAPSIRISSTTVFLLLSLAMWLNG